VIIGPVSPRKGGHLSQCEHGFLAVLLDPQLSPPERSAEKQNGPAPGCEVIIDMRGVSWKTAAVALFLLGAPASDAFLPTPSAPFLPRSRACACVQRDARPSLRMMSGFGTPKPAAGGKKKKKGAKGGAAVQAPTTAGAPRPMQQQLAAIDVKKVIDQIDDTQDPFWQLIEPLLLSEFPAPDVERVLGFIQHATGRKGLPADIVEDKWRPHGDIHAFMEGIPASPFRDTSAFPFVAELERRYDEIKAEFEALLEHDRERFQSVTSMNYESGWKTLVLYFNGHRIEDFPYERCPVTASILDTIPIAGRIAGFNRQAPNSGIPLHSDGNNMWLTCQMGIKIPDGHKAWIRVGPETRRWSDGKCMIYDTTFEHETFNESAEQERVVLHIDFWNFVDLTPVELTAMQRVYQLREMFLRAEGLIETGGKL
jgi:hypothetical protein